METSLSKSDEILLHYGKFFFAFEGICDVMRSTITFLIFTEFGDKESNQANILMEGLAADQLRAKFLALIVNEFAADTEIYQLSKVISSCLEKIIPIRNSFAHGKSVIGKSGFLKESTDSTLMLQHLKLKKKGLDDTYKKFEISHFETYIECMTELRSALVNLIIRFASKAHESNFLKAHDITIKKDREKLIEWEKNISQLN